MRYFAVEGWCAYRFYVLGYEPDLRNPRFAAGGREVRRIISEDKPAAFTAARGTGRIDKGEPDVFLFNERGESMFAEVKVDQDQLDAEGIQLQCLAQIRTILGCRAEIVRVLEETRARQPRTYWVEPAPKGLTPLRHGVT
jgi:hypothetical protein